MAPTDALRAKITQIISNEKIFDTIRLMFKKMACIILVLSGFVTLSLASFGATKANAMVTNPIFAAESDCNVEPITKENCGIVDILVTTIRVLSGLVGVVVVVMIAYGGVQYALARDNPQAVSAAKSKIVNAILALVFYLMIFGFLQWVVPGGVL